ncbi:unnamed protein product [Linum tenue]|uniref:Cytochrome P450 n=1 Tax=Linum tenue TaxID=586396 RepID=A0AAV0JKE0_9ROSI|nr:unnamed protein product [Linum tenue]
METGSYSIWAVVSAVVAVAVTASLWRVMNWLWIRPKRLERYLRSQGFDGRPYRFLKGDMKEALEMVKEAKSRQLDISDDAALRVFPFPHHTVKTYGKKSFTWVGPVPRVNIMNPEHIKEVLTKIDDYPKSRPNPLMRLLATGIAIYNGEKWARHRRILNPAFHQEKLKIGRQVYIPGWRFVPTKLNTRMKQVHKEIQEAIQEIINKREKAMRMGEVVSNNDLLGLLMESNNNSGKNGRMTLEDVIEECKLFYFAGQETTSAVLVWTMILLSKYPVWQERARHEVLHVFGTDDVSATTLDSSGLSRLKTMTMILHEVMRLYPPLMQLTRAIERETKMGDFVLPTGIQVALPAILVHKDPEIWGSDAGEFNPERFVDGISKATKNPNQQGAYFPFGWGPRICIGQNFALMEAKMALVIILKRFSFELAPSYVHAPSTEAPIPQPQFGARLILHKL